MSIHPAAPAQTTLALASQHTTIPCGRDDLHMCRVTSPDMLMSLWPWMRTGLLRIKRKNTPDALWLPEHVLLEIQKGFVGQSAVECFVAHDGTEDTLAGFLVVYPELDPFVHVPLCWFVWMANLTPGVLLRLIPEFEAEAVRRGFLRWKWRTSRTGWARRATLFGASVVEYTIGKSLEPAD